MKIADCKTCGKQLQLGIRTWMHSDGIAPHHEAVPTNIRDVEVEERKCPLCGKNDRGMLHGVGIC